MNYYSLQPSVEMMVNDFDDEQTLEEEEILASKEQVDPSLELNDLRRESEMSIEDLLKLYGAPASDLAASTSGNSRKRRRRASPKRIAPEEPSTSSASASASVEKVEESADEEDAATTSATTNNMENQSVADDETNFEEEEPSELNKLYTDLESKENEQGLSEDEDFDYEPDDEPKKTIMVGSDYQAQIPEGLCKYDDALPYENEDKLVWDPKLTDSEIKDYLTKFSQINTNGGTNGISQGGKHHRDDEQALLLLLQCGNNV